MKSVSRGKSCDRENELDLNGRVDFILKENILAYV